MNFRKVRAIIRREYVEHIRKKTFWIFTILMPVLWMGMIALSVLTGHRLTGTKTVAVVDRTGAYFVPLRDEIARSKDRSTIRVVAKPVGPAGLDALKVELTKLVNTKNGAEKLDAFVILDKDALEKGEIEYWAASVSDILFQTEFERHLNRALLEARLEAHGMPPDVVAEVQKTVSLDVKSLNPRSTAGFWISYIFMFFLFFTLIQYGMANLRGVIEEKANRIVELVISSVRPSELMLGKIVGIGLVGLTQYAIWSVLAMNIALLSGTVLATLVPGGTVPTIPLPVILYFILYFILGYFFFASIYTAIGAPFNSDQEAQQLAMLPTWMMALPMFFWWVIVNNPNSTFSIVLSLIPFMTPVVMFMRVTLAPVPAWQILASVGIMIASIFVMAVVAGKIYRVGILMYGKKPTVPEIWRWARHGPRPAPAAAAPEPEPEAS